MPIEKETELKIFEAAQKVFQESGFEGARMQEIANEAGINKSMLHYYYRNKDTLFMAVFQSGAKKIMPKLFGVLASDISLREKVEQIVEFYHDMFVENPQLPAFVIYEMNQHPQRFKDFIVSMGVQLPEIFIDQVEDAVDSGKLRSITADQFLMNVVSMCMMPMLARNMVQTILHLTDDEYLDFLNERRKIIPSVIFNGLII